MAVSPTDTPLPQRYRIVRKLGRGGMATVFLAEDERLGRRVAVKRLHADSPADVARRFEREAKVGASLNHPNIVTIYDTAVDDEGVLIVMEYVEGETLSEALSRGRLEPARAIEVARGVAAALDYAHANGVVHRDVKPANVLLGRTGTVKLVDLGIATATESTRLTASGTVLGTPAYMAPEQLEGRSFGSKVDIYSLAALAFEMLGGRKARQGETPLEIAHRAVTEPPPDLREVWPEAPPRAAELLRRGMARAPSERPASAGELAVALADAVERPAPEVASDPTMQMAPTRPAPPPARPAPPPRPAPSRPLAAPQRARRRRWPWIAAATAFAALVAVFALVAAGGDDTANQQADSGQRAERDRDRGSTAERQPDATDAPAPAPADPPAPAPEDTADDPSSSGEVDPELGKRLNDQGFALLQQGRAEDAVPRLERAVAAFPEDSQEVDYAFALFNYGQALRMTGRPEEAIPILERRLEFPNQRDVVQRELDLAREQAGGG